jgi:hypothetical protein
MKSNTELKGGIVSVLAQVALQAALPYAIEYALGDAGDLDKRQAEERQKATDAYFAAENARVEKENRMYEEALQREQDAKNRKQMEIAQKRQLSEAKNMEAVKLVGEERQRVADEERIKQQELHQKRVKETAERFASERQKSTEALQRATQQNLSDEYNAMEQKNAIMRSNIDQMSNLNLQQQQQRQREMAEVQRLRQNLIAKEVQHRMEVVPTQVRRQVAKAKTTLRRGRGVNQEVIQYLTQSLGLSIKDAKKVLKAYF